MSTHIFTKEKTEQIREKALKELLYKAVDEKQKQNQVKVKEVMSDRNLQRQIVENIWYKLYMLQNYNVSMDMFRGSNLRWTTIITYLTYIRAIYKGFKYKDPLPRGLVNYVHGLMDSGTEPYMCPKDFKVKVVTKQQLLQAGVLTNQQVNYIFSSVGIDEEQVDTSSAWTRKFTQKQDYNIHHNEHYTNIINSNLLTNPLNKNELKLFTPKSTTIDLNLRKLGTLKSLFRL